MKKFALILVAALVALTLASCNLFGIGTGITMYNNTSGSINYVFIAPVGSQYWGVDQLGTDVIPSGSSYNFAVTSSTVHVAADLDGSVDVYGYYYWEIYNVPTTGPLYTAVYVTDTSIHLQTEDGLIVDLPSRVSAAKENVPTQKTLSVDGGAIAK